MFTIIDAVMGTGKSTAAIEHVNETPEHKFIILTPLTKEVTRYKKGLSSAEGKGGLRNDIQTS